ncbi:MAG: NUDIX domain-containing protein [Alphaproteobacteria bacterium]|nr:NUDIX domain-containing protein [Alphaproteobacteria bacterium]
MPEIIDLYNNARQIVGSADRKSPIPNGLNKLSVHVWFINKFNQFLLQQRVATAKKFPNMWGQTGGGAIKGESSWDTCVRESVEELGIKPTIENSVLVGTFKRPSDFVDVWLVYADTDIKDLKLQESEVQNAKWATQQEIQQMQENGTFIPSIISGLQMVYNYINMTKKVQTKGD